MPTEPDKPFGQKIQVLRPMSHARRLRGLGIVSMVPIRRENSGPNGQDVHYVYERLYGMRWNPPDRIGAIEVGVGGHLTWVTGERIGQKAMSGWLDAM